MLSFDDLVNLLPTVVDRPAIQSTSGEITYIKAANARYVPPPFKELEGSSTGSPSVIIITASAAVGKSVTARELAFRTGAPVWNLVNVLVGDHTFVGGTVKHFGPAFLEVTEALADGRFLIVLDALDEADLAVGGASFEAFIDGVCKEFQADRPKPTLVMLARGDTSDTIELKLMEYGVPYAHYRIDFFDADGARTFVERMLLYEQEAPTPALGTAVNAMFNFIVDLLKPQGEDPWQDENVRSFLGYAPVIEAVARFLKGKNYIVVVNDLKEACHDLTGAKRSSPWPVLVKLINDLLLREQGKFVEGLRPRLGSDAEDWRGLDNAYTPEEQLHHICRKNFPGEHAELVPAGLPNHNRPVYLEAVAENLESHPLLGDQPSGYPNRVFQEYVYAFGLQQGDETSRDAVRMRMRGNDYLPTPLLGRFLLIGSADGGDPTVRAADFAFLYESLLSQATEKDQILLDIYEIVTNGDDEEVQVEAEITVRNLVNTSAIVRLTELGQGIHFNRRLCSATIEVPCNVCIGNLGRDFKLGPDVELRSVGIEVRAKLVEVTGAPDTEVVLQAEHCDSTNIPDVRLLTGAQFGVSWTPDFYPWSSYRYVDPDTKVSAPDSNDAFRHVSRILRVFRAEGHKGLCRYHKHVNNRVVGRHPNAQHMLNYLISEEILLINGPLYCLNQEKLSALGINRENLKNRQVPDGARDFLARFISSL